MKKRGNEERRHQRKETLAGKKKGWNYPRGRRHGGFVTCLSWVSKKMPKAKWTGMDCGQYQLSDSN